MTHTAYLLRFQEAVPNHDAHGIKCGTQTFTKVRAEQQDPDPASTQYRAVPNNVTWDGGSGASLAEQYPFPGGRDRVMVMATQTTTAVRAEATDQDPGECRGHVIPR